MVRLRPGGSDSRFVDEGVFEERTLLIAIQDRTGQGTEEYFKPDCIRTTQTPVPRYFNHHVEVEKNVVAPQTSMAFYPHKGDLDSPRKQKKWKGYIKELDKSEIRSGLDSIKVDQKRAVVIQYERIVEVSRYLETWLKDLAIPELTKWSLLKLLINQDSRNVLSAEGRARILASRPVLDCTPAADAAAEMFLEAWKTVFKEERAGHGIKLPAIDLLSVFQLDEDFLASADSPAASDIAQDDQDKGIFENLESKLGTYSSLGCLICFKHSCEHGFYTDFNQRERFSLEKGTIARRLTDKQRGAGASRHNSLPNGTAVSGSPCRRKCYRSQRAQSQPQQWTDDDQKVLRCIFLSMASSQVKTDPICHVAALLDRDCCDVQWEYQKLNLPLPKQRPAPPVDEDEDEVPSLSWYNRYKKKLSKRHGAAKYHKPNWDHIRRDIDSVCALRGCDHDGPCTPENPDCPCARKGQFCEKFCGCSVDECAYKFTGCACHSRGKTCNIDQKGEECICIQLNRECDPDLCGSCGAVERADPRNAQDDELHSTGCQNCALQRGMAKCLVMGRSQFHGYGLFAAENIRKDSFIIEYAGELVSGHEGDRRYIRRQNLFDGTKALSFNFTLLKECDVWIDGARYGNLSRYINHEKDGGQRCNMVPRIVLVNGGFRIEFRAKRNIKAWEELSFDYGEDFGLDIENKSQGKKSGNSRGAARKNAQRISPTPDRATQDTSSDSDMESESEDMEFLEDVPPNRKRKRDLRDGSEEEDDVYEPTGSDKSVRSATSRDSTESQQPPRMRVSGRGRGRGRGGASRGAPLVSGRSTRTTRRSGNIPGSTETSGPEEDLAPDYRATRRKRRRLSRVVEINDSEDDELEMGEDNEVEDEGEEQVDVKVEEDSEDSTPPRRDQPVRNRRQPAKFRDDELWAFKPARRERQ